MRKVRTSIAMVLRIQRNQVSLTVIVITMGFDIDSDDDGLEDRNEGRNGNGRLDGTISVGNTYSHYSSAWEPNPYDSDSDDGLDDREDVN